MKNNRLLFATSLATSLLFTAHSLPAIASDDAADAGENQADIVVTALKRETRLLDTPASITSLSDERMRQASLESANDLVRTVPSLTITDQGPGQRRVTLRGIRSAGDAQVGIYYDEMALAGPPGTTSDPGGSQSDFKLFDLERVEVLRGPQGTLYGAGSVGGAIRLVTRKPSFDFGGVVDVTGTTTKSGGEGYQLNAAINLPIVNDVLAVRGVYFRRQNDGWVNNPGLGLTGINAERSDGGRILVRFLPLPGLTIDGSAHFLFTEGGASTWSPGAGRYNAVNASQVPYEDKQRLYNLTVRAELGFADLIATTSYQDRDTLVTRDPTALFRSFKGSAANCTTRFSAASCATPAGIANFNAYVDSLTPAIYYQPQSVKDWTSEVRLQSSRPGWLQWTLGGFYEDRDAKVLSEARRTSTSDGAQIPGATPLLRRNVVDYLTQKAVFGEVSVSPVETLTLTSGLRYYEYDKTVGGDTTIGLDILRTAVAPYALYGSHASGWLYKANVSWKPIRNVLVYGQVATGYRPGGVNQVLGLAQALSYSPDKLTTYEGGLKGSFADDAVVVNLAGYITDWTDMQVSIDSGSFVYLGNAGAARIKGIEAEVAVTPTPGLTFNLNAVFTSAKLTRDQVPDNVTPRASTARAGDRIPFIAPQTIGVAGSYDWALGGDWRGLVRGDLTYVGKSYADFRPTAIGYRRVGDYTLANARIGAKTDRYGVYLFVNNLTNTIARTAAGNTLGGTTETVTTVPPRTIGINLTGSF